MITSIILGRQDPDFVLVLAGDRVYKMDYRTMLEEHVGAGAELTIACIDVALQDAQSLGVMALDADDRVSRFLESRPSRRRCPGRVDRALPQP